MKDRKTLMQVNYTIKPLHHLGDYSGQMVVELVVNR